MSTLTVINDLQRVDPVSTAIARSLVKQAQGRGQAVPDHVNLAAAITAVAPEAHIQGADALKVTVHDENFDLMDSGFFHPPKAKLVPQYDLNYPDGSRFWWRLSIVSPQDDHTITLTFINRAIAKLMFLFGPIKAARSKVTRAEFIKSVVKRVPEIEFFSFQLDVKQPTSVAIKGTSVPSAPSGRKASGIGNNARGLTAKGQPLTAGQITTANILLAQGEKDNAPETALIAMIFAAIWESGLDKDSPPNSLGYAGALAGSVHNFPNYHDAAAQAHEFLVGGRGYGGGSGTGAIALSRGTSNAVEIAVRTEVPSIWPSNAYASESGYPGDAAAAAEAKRIVDAAGGSVLGGGGAAGGVAVDTQAYTFEIGTSSNPTESLWDGINRLAQEVNWELFLDGDRMYYDSEVTLVRQAPAIMLNRDDACVVGWSYDAEARNIATQMNLSLEAPPFEFHAGDVVQLDESFGPAGVFSTVDKPGRWLITDAQAQSGTLTVQYTMKQPTLPKPEPAPATTTTSGAGSGLSVVGGTPVDAVNRTFAAAQELDAFKRPYSINTRQLTMPPPGPFAPNGPSPQSSGMDCSSSSAWVLWRGGIYNGPTSWAWTTQFQTQYGVAGRGQYITLWCNNEHVFIEFNLPGNHMQMNTVNPGSQGPRLIPWSYSNLYAGDGATHGFFIARHWPGT